MARKEREKKEFTREKAREDKRESNWVHKRESNRVHKGVCEIGLAARCPGLRSAVRVSYTGGLAVQCRVRPPRAPAFGASVYCM